MRYHDEIREIDVTSDYLSSYQVDMKLVALRRRQRLGLQLTLGEMGDMQKLLQFCMADWSSWRSSYSSWWEDHVSGLTIKPREKGVTVRFRYQVVDLQSCGTVTLDSRWHLSWSMWRDAMTEIYRKCNDLTPRSYVLRPLSAFRLGVNGCEAPRPSVEY